MESINIVEDVVKSTILARDVVALEYGPEFSIVEEETDFEVAITAEMYFVVGISNVEVRDVLEARGVAIGIGELELDIIAGTEEVSMPALVAVACAQ